MISVRFCKTMKTRVMKLKIQPIKYFIIYIKNRNMLLFYCSFAQINTALGKRHLLKNIELTTSSVETLHPIL